MNKLLANIHYTSDFEKEAFEQYFLKNKENYFELFLAVNPEIDASFAQNSIDRYEKFREKNRGGIEARNSTKKLRHLYKLVHDEFLIKYELDNHFKDIFTNGRYNCVSASALYALSFRDFGIPYLIKEVPTHVFLVAYPDKEQVMVETTDPAKGFYTFDYNFKNSFVNYLKDSKLITSEDQSKMNTNQLFDKYFFKEDQVNLKELVGLQYYNDGVYHFQKEEFLNGYRQFQKAYLFYPSDKILYNLLVSAGAYIDRPGQNNDKIVAGLIAELSLLPEEKIQSKHLHNEFSKIAHKNLIEQYNPKYMEEIYEELLARVKRDSLIKEISFLYNYERGRIYLTRGSTQAALDFAELAYELKPTHTEAENLLINSIQEKIRPMNDIFSIAGLVGKYAVKYPELIANNNYCQMMLQVKLGISGSYCEMNNIQAAEKHLLEFEEMLAVTSREVIIDGNLVAMVYSRLATHYYKKSNYAKSRRILEKGLEVSPNNSELKRRLEIVIRG